MKERYKKLISEVRNNEKLVVDHINAANQLLRSQFEELQCLSSPVMGQNLSFRTFDWMQGMLITRFCIQAQIIGLL